jgi:DNA-binding PucR family transcriptional regulator
MKLVLFETSERREPTPGLLTERGIVGLADTVETNDARADRPVRSATAGAGAAGVGGRGPASRLCSAARAVLHTIARSNFTSGHRTAGWLTPTEADGHVST